jgi:hypothetical protein
LSPHRSPGRFFDTAGRVRSSGLRSTSVTDARLRLETEAWEPLILDINSPFIAGWRISLDGQPVSSCIEHRSGYMQVFVPAGVHTVDAMFGNTWVRAAGNMVTFLGVVGCLLLAYSEVQRRRRRDARRQSGTRAVA